MLGSIRLQKMKRIAESGKPQVVDLFSGSGGISLGFKKAGFEILAGLEIDSTAARTHARNFFKNHDPESRKRHEQPRDITSLEPQEFLSDLYPDVENPAALVDVVVGGPPCQAFARIGRAKLREIAGHPDAFKLDPRGQLYERYLHYIRELNPLVIVMENVPDIVNYGGVNVAEKIARELEAEHYKASYTFLNAVHYGVPQFRERLILIAIAEELEVDPFFPPPTHWADLTSGYKTARGVALQTVYLSDSDELGSHHFAPPPSSRRKLKKYVSAREALSDLPKVEHPKRGPREFTLTAHYVGEPSDYARLMRHWKGYESEVGVRDHVIRSLPRDYPIFKLMKPGDQYPEAYDIAMDLFEKQLKAEKRKRRQDIPVGSTAYNELKKKIVPPYNREKFPNKWRKLEAHLPARTLMAHLGKDSYSHIHYDDGQSRTISVREAARLQSFPDGFKFEGAMNAAFRQIGNAVPPLLAFSVAKAIKVELLRASRSNIARTSKNARG